MTYTLVAVDCGPTQGVTPNFDHLVSRLGDAVIGIVTGTEPHWKTGAPQTVHRIELDANRLRNTEAHGIGYRCAFLVHIDDNVAPENFTPNKET